MYDYAHVLTDALEGITHSLCTLEFEAHRPLYDWILQQLQPVLLVPRPPRGRPGTRPKLGQPSQGC
eukprot:3003898-Prymnesium_polylepis.1